MIVVLALLVAACGGGGSSAGVAANSTTASSRSSTVPAASASNDPLAYSRCMRSNGVSKYPDPSSGHELPSGLTKVNLQQLGVSSSQFQAAERACAHLLLSGGHGAHQSERQQALNGMLRFSECLRAHGLRNWPDPSNGSQGPFFNLLNYHGIAPDSPQGQAAAHECQHLIPAQFNGNIRVER